MTLDVVLPAGGRISESFAEAAGTTVKALIKFDGKTVLERVVERLREAGVDGRMVVVGPEELISDAIGKLVDAIIPEVGTGPDNILAGLQYLQETGQTGKAIIANTDLPFMSAQSIRSFLAACPDDLDVCAPVIDKEDFEAHYPGLRAEFVPLKDGLWTMGCLFMVSPAAISENRQHIDKVFEARKSQLRMASLLGLGFVLRLLLHKLAIGDIERRCSAMLGCRVGAVITSDADLAFDLDTQAEYEYACRYFSDSQLARK